TVGSSPKTSSPSSASAIARRISGVGCVTVSERRSIRWVGMANAEYRRGVAGRRSWARRGRRAGVLGTQAQQVDRTKCRLNERAGQSFGDIERKYGVLEGHDQELLVDQVMSESDGAIDSILTTQSVQPVELGQIVTADPRNVMKSTEV